MQQSQPELRAVLTKPLAQVRKVLIAASANLVRSLTELVYNLLNGNVPLTRSQKTRLSKHKLLLAKLGNPKLSIAAKKKLLARSRSAPKILKLTIKLLAKQLPWLNEWL